MAVTKVNTKYGTVVGEALQDRTVFRGVPFAKPPVGELRFQAPRKPDPWTGEKICTKNPPCCIQNTDDPMFPLEVSEDCLYLNVFTPAESEKSSLPVMVWFFGGGFSDGGISDPEFDGAALNAQGVILVTVNYRCNIFGFFSNRELEEKYGYMGNVGILDQILSLHWVQDNIRAFGGDPDNVTIFGQSAGGVSVRIHLTNELSKGLFHKAIIESGGGFNEADLMRPKEEFQSMCDEILSRVGWTAQDLMEKDAMEIYQKMMGEARALLEGKEVGFFQPFIDGEVMKAVPGVAIHDQAYADVPIICGTVPGDSWMFSRKVLPELLEVGNVSYYRGFAISPHQAWGSAQSAWDRKSPFYAYYFERQQPPELGAHFHKLHFGAEAPHGAEVAYVFGSLSARNVTDPEELAISDKMVTYWANFAKTGCPDADGPLTWPAYTAENPVTMHFTNEKTAAEDIVLDEDEKKVLEFVKNNPGMLVSLDNFW